MKKVLLSIIILFITCSVMAQSATKSYAFRLKPGADLKKEIDAFINQHHIRAAAIVTCVGSLTDANIRFANQPDGTLLHGHFEILSLTGVLSINGSHLHLSISDEKGNTVGGHLLEGCKIYTTAEIVISVLTDLEFKRELDSTYGYKELVVKKIKD